MIWRTRSTSRTALRRIGRFLALPRAERWLVLRAYVTLGVIDLGLRTVGFRRLINDAPKVKSLARHEVTPEAWRRACAYARWIDVVSRHHVVRAQCLHRSLALHHWLRREGLPSRLRIGVRKVGRELQAHAWVELSGRPLNDHPSAVAMFTPLVALDGRPPTWVDAGPAPALPPVSLPIGPIREATA